MRPSDLICKTCGQRIMLPDRPPWLVCGCNAKRPGLAAAGAER